MGEIIPTVFAKDRKIFMNRFRKVLIASRKIQVDFADGKFVPTTLVDINCLPSFSRQRVVLEAHLMVRNPEKYIESLRRKGFKKVIFHIEAVDSEDVASIIARIRALGMIPVVALKPETRITKKILAVVDSTRCVLLMGVYPGKEKQKLRKSVYGRIKTIKAHSKKIIVQIDGGVNIKTAKLLFKAGADTLHSGSYISESSDPKKALKELQG
jgi:ribulose-phosphate 3-epimerase